MIALLVWLILLAAGPAGKPDLPPYVVDFNYDTRIVFSSNLAGNEDLYLLSRKGLVRLTDDPAADLWPVPDRDGKMVVFTSNRAGNYDIYTLDLETNVLNRLTNDPRDELSPSWSVDNRFVYFDLTVKRGDSQTMKLDIQSGQTIPLFPDPKYSSTILAFESPRGNEIVFTAKVFLGWLVAKFDRAQGSYSELTKRGTCRAKFSPDGSLVTYVGHDDDGLGDVFVMAPDGSGKRNLTRSRSKTYDYYPCFSPDGKMIVFSSSAKEKGKNGYQLHTLDLQSGEVKRILTTSGNDSFPYWFK
jgi:Tol biopolymer transport system component